MIRKSIAFLIVGFALLAASPAKAYCILNKTADTLTATLADYHPLADFNATLKPGKKVCCDWFDRRCNPTGNRGALISIKIEGQKGRTKWKKAASAELEHRNSIRKKSKNAKIERRRKEKRVNSVLNALEIPESFDSLYCVDGIKRSVRASAGGTVTITRSGSNAGRLNCASHDVMLRPVNALSRSPKSGPALIYAPPNSDRPRKAPTLRDELMR
ncbi:MAG: hypothetical protein HOM58_19750 [Rhodospirillaceae bacterium]|jgi:hypothetical protein|nr:hypothetical protein [Rhodospirillaceae bacterium]MBT5459933.1 hypothetical protein [Rhodospirillaceae bacterium]